MVTLETGSFLVPCEEYREYIAAPTMVEIDKMPKEWRDLIHEFGPAAHELYEPAVPAMTGGRAPKRMTATAARRFLETGVYAR